LAVASGEHSQANGVLVPAKAAKLSGQTAEAVTGSSWVERWPGRRAAVAKPKLES